MQPHDKEKMDAWDILAGTYDQLIWRMSDEFRHSIRAALDRLAATLGREYLPDPDHTHPLIQRHIHVPAPWTPQWLQRLCDRIDAVRDCPGGHELLLRLADPKGWDVARSELDVAAPFRLAGCEIGIEPDVAVGKKRRKPDLLVRLPGGDDELFVEVSLLEQSAKERSAWWSMSAVTRLADRLRVHHSGILHTVLAPKSADELARRAEGCARQAMGDGALVELVEPGTLEFAFAPTKELLEEWCSERELTPGQVQGPRRDTDPVARFAKKIEDERRQLPPDKPGLVVIETMTGVFLHATPERVASELKQTLFKHERLIGVAIADSFQGPLKSASVETDDWTFAQHLRFGRLIEQRMLIRNKFSCAQVDEPMMAALNKAVLEVY